MKTRIEAEMMSQNFESNTLHWSHRWEFILRSRIYKSACEIGYPLASGDMEKKDYR